MEKRTKESRPNRDLLFKHALTRHLINCQFIHAQLSI